MKLLLTFAIVCTLGQLHAQTILSKAETSKIFSNPKIPVRLAYTYTDNTGKYYLALQESIDSIAEKNDTLHYTIKGVCLQATDTGTVKKWELNDHKNREIDDETSIWFWTKFCELKDIDGDGMVEPIIVYGTSGMNGTGDGRIKILIYYKGIKTAIRHQNSEMDDGRFTNIDASFYTLPVALQQHIKGLMKTLDDKNLAIFPIDFEAQMKKKPLQIQ